MKGLAALFLVTAPIFMTSSVWASKLKITGVYSNMRFGTEDVTGVEILLVFSRAGYYAVMQCAEGAPGVPMVLPAKVAGSSVEIEPPLSKDSRCPNSKFRGTIEESGLRGTFEGTDWPGFLERGSSYWQ